MLGLYRRLPEEVRRCIRPLNLLEEGASLLPGRLRADVGTAVESVRRVALLRRLRYPVRRLEGRASGDGDRRLTCLLAMDDGAARYWSGVLFAAPPREAIVGDVPAVGVRRAAARLAPAVDLSLWQAPWPTSRLPGGGAVVPAWIPLSVATDRPLDAVVTGDRSGREARKNDLRRVNRLGFTTRVTSEANAFDAFRRNLFEPYCAQRFGDLFVAPPAHTFRHARRHGWLLLVEREGGPVAGAVLERWRGDLRILAFGVDPGAEIPSGSALAACYYHSLRFAVERGFPRLSFGTCRPVLTDGVLRYKRKWGGRLDGPLSWDAFLLRYHNTPAVRAALTEAPLVVDDGRGRLVALLGAAGAAGRDLQAHVRQLDTAGLAELACLVDGEVHVGGDFGAPHSTVRAVPPGEVWPAAAAA